MTDAASAIRDYVARPFGTFAELFRLQAMARPDHLAILCGDAAATYRELDDLADRVAAALQRDGVTPGDVVAICASPSIAYAAVFIGTLRAGAAITPLPPSATPEQLSGMLRDSRAKPLFVDGEVSTHLRPITASILARRVTLDAADEEVTFGEWLAPAGDRSQPIEVEPDQPFNILYSSGTTGTPKGIVQSHRMRWPHNYPADPPGYGPDAVAIISTALYSNTTLVSFLPALAGGGTVVLMPRFDVRRFLELSERHRVTHAMLVPIQYRRILDDPEFDRFDLDSFKLKYATSAPFPAELKAEVLRRWPGGLVEYYGMTEGGGSCQLYAHLHPDKLATVGRPMDGHDIRIIDDAGRELPPGEVGEVVGHSPAMMNGYLNRPRETAEAEWRSPDGRRFIRTGDLASKDAEGFFTLIGRKKDLIISGGTNIYPIDLETVLLAHPAVREAAVVGAKSRAWGETPIGFVTLAPDATAEGPELCRFANGRLGRTQRLSDVRIVDALPRSAIGKVLKRELQDRLSLETIQ